ncbi:MAG: hypothetical protein GY929_03800 [Actinomycetia bacterium]|nr:hypothetical protein [Actinomycetes bacterium]
MLTKHSVMLNRMDEQTAAATYAAFRSRTLPKPQWTHEAHLAVCWTVLQTESPAEALEDLRVAISSYNESTNTPNTDSSGYHETLTRYFIAAVAQHRGRPLSDVLGSAECSRQAPAAHWSGDVLYRAEVRLGWMPPHLAPLPWSLPEVTPTEGGAVV